MKQRLATAAALLCASLLAACGAMSWGAA